LIDPSQLYTTVTAAEELGVSQQRIRALIAAGRLQATLIGSVYLITPEQLDAVRDRKPGRPWAKTKASTK
jgi:excisionase family DNA binding protein